MSKEIIDKINNNLIMLVEGFDDAERDYGYDMANEKHYVSELIELVKNLSLSGVSKRYFLFECINADRQKLKKLIIAPDRGTAIADIETNYPYIEKWYSSEELNVC